MGGRRKGFLGVLMGKDPQPSDSYSKEETEQRLQRTLKAAFNMKPTPLKEIPRKHRQRKTSKPK
jgi:hypothetical protein